MFDVSTELWRYLFPAGNNSFRPLSPLTTTTSQSTLVWPILGDHHSPPPPTTAVGSEWTDICGPLLDPLAQLYCWRDIDNQNRRRVEQSQWSEIKLGLVWPRRDFCLGPVSSLVCVGVLWVKDGGRDFCDFAHVFGWDYFLGNLVSFVKSFEKEKLLCLFWGISRIRKHSFGIRTSYWKTMRDLEKHPSLHVLKGEHSD